MAELKATTFALTGVAALVGGVVGSLLTVTLVRPRVETNARPEATSPTEAVPAPAPTSALDGRLAALERSVRALSLRDSMLQAAKPAASGGKEGHVDVAPIVDNPVFEAAVRDVMERAELERSEERDAERVERRRQASETWASQLSEKLQLTDQQRAKAAAISLSFTEKLRGLRQPDGSELPRDQRRARMAELRTAAEAELAKVLSPAQMNGYRELEDAQRLGGRRGARAAAERAPGGSD